MPTHLVCCVSLVSVALYSSCGQSAIRVQYDIVEDYSFSSSELNAIQDIADEAVEEIRRLLPTLPDELVLHLRVGDDVSPELGASATQASNTIYWTVDPERGEGVKAIAEAHLRPTLFHELHHMARGPIGYYSLIDRVVTEGLASAFERDFADATYPWSEYPEEVREWVIELLALPPTARGIDWMILHPDGRRWIGMRAGTYLVDRAMTASGLSAADLVATPTDEILAMAKARHIEP